MKNMINISKNKVIYSYDLKLSIARMKLYGRYTRKFTNMKKLVI